MDIRNQRIRDSYNYVLQSDLITGVVYRIGGQVPSNPIFKSGSTVEGKFFVDNIQSITTGITVYSDVLPNEDGIINLGTQSQRFRDINTVSGSTSYWTSSVKIITPELDLGIDSMGNPRKITADNSIIQNDVLYGGNF